MLGKGEEKAEKKAEKKVGCDECVFVFVHSNSNSAGPPE